MKHLLVLAVAVSAILFGYRLGKHDADRWYANHPLEKICAPFNSYAIGYGNTVEGQSGGGKTIAIGKNLKVSGSEIVGIACTEETAGSTVHGKYQDYRLNFVCTGKSWVAK